MFGRRLTRVDPLFDPAPGEYIDDTEDYINIQLDYSRNRLLRLEIMITVGIPTRRRADADSNV